MPTQPDQISPKTVSATEPAIHACGRAGIALLTPLVLVCLTFGGAGLLCGCTLPSDCGDLDYPTYGGAWQRTRRDSGRVGSLFDPAGARAATLTDRDEAADVQNARSPREGIHSTPPVIDRDRRPIDPNELPEPSPSDRLDRERLRALDLDEIDIEAGSPAPPDLN